MREFTYIPEAFVHVRKKVIVVQVITISGFFLLSGFVPLVLYRDPSKLIALPFVLIFFLIVALVRIRSAIVREKVLYNSLKLLIDDHHITLQRKDIADLIIKKSEVRSISKKSNGNFVIRGRNQFYTMYIFPFVNDLGSFEATLNEISPIRYLQGKANELWFLPISICAAFAIIALGTTQSQFVKVISFVALLALLVVGFVISQANRKLDRSTRILSLVIFIPLIAAFFYLIFR